MSIPESLQECVEELKFKLGSYNRGRLAKQKPSELWKYFHTVGSYVEKKWLKEGGPLWSYLQSIGLESMDDMKGMIVAALYREIRKKPVTEEILLQELQEFWKDKHRLTTRDWEQKLDIPGLKRPT